ncbi:MAG: hypothetical protein JNL67_04305 [Planctomycetaceae bacterium]|nr:hypothetical protein [Planctomycetaceae bacterium]
MHVHEERILLGTQELTLHCRHCGAVHVTDAVRVKTVDRLWGLIPLWVTCETAIKCPSCQTTYTCNQSLETLAAQTPEQLNGFFRTRIGLVPMTIVILGWVVICAFPVSAVLFLIGYFLMPRAATGWRRSALIGLCLTLTVLALFILMSIIVGK